VTQKASAPAAERFVRSVLRLALPYAAQQLFYSVLSLVEVWMLGQLGETAVAAAGLAKQVYFVFTLFLFGLSSGSAIFTAQFWGQQDLRGIHRVLGICLLLSLAVSLLFSLPAVASPRAVLSIYSQDPAVVALGSEYLWIVGLSFVATGIVFAYSAVLRSTGNVRLPMAVGVFSLGVNTLLSYLLIFGFFGLPPLGVRGMAIATCFSRYLECVLLLVATYARHTPAAARFAQMHFFDGSFLKGFFKTSLPVVLTEVLWSLGITTYNLVYARIGTESIAAFSICSTIEGMAFVPFLGLANACAILIGNKIGAREEGKAMDYARRFIVIGAVGAVLTGVATFLIRDVALSFYRISPMTLEYARNILVVLALFQWVKMSNLTILIGIIRSGGDTGVGFLIDAGSMWVVGVPLALAGAFLLHLPVYWVVAMVMADEVTKLCVGLPRVLSRKWIHQVTR
jgi:putative MATE family efflux protein